MSEKFDAFQAISERIKPILAGVDPDLQGAVLADLVAIYVAGHNPALREDVITIWVETMRKLVPVNEKIIMGDKGWPG